MKKKLTPREWIALSVSLLVLVGFGLAYSVYVPKTKELAQLDKELQTAKSDRSLLMQKELPLVVSEEEKKALAQLTPVSLEQARFLKQVREEEKNTGVVIKSLNFESEDSEKPSDASASASAPAAQQQLAEKKAALLQETKGTLSVEGSYPQIRKFLEQFSKLQRLVTFDKWNFSTQRQTITSTLSNVVGQEHLNGTSAANAIHVQNLALEFRDNAMLTNRSPIYTEAEYKKVVQQIYSKYLLEESQKSIDIANLEIQQTSNRYVAGMLKSTQAISVFEQETTAVYIAGANPRVREVLGLAPYTESSGPSPGPLMTQPTLTSEGSRIQQYTVLLDIDFKIYHAPGAKDLLPATDPIQTYEPTKRTNSVEPW